MRIAVLQHTFNPTTLGWVRGLERRGHHVRTIIANPKEPYGGWPQDLDVVVVPDSVEWVGRIAARLLPGRKQAVYRIPRPRALRDALRDFSADAVLVKVYSLRNVIALLVALQLRIRRVAWIEQVPPPNLEWRLLRAAGVLPRRMFTALDARPGGIAEPLARPAGGMPVISYAPVIPEVPARRPVDARQLRVLTAAAFWDPDHKRPFWTLEAARDAGLLDGRLTFTFTGLGRDTSPSLERLRALISTLGVERLVDVRLNVPFVDMSAVYAAHDVLVLPSAWEQFGMVVPEAMAHGLAVVASDRVGSVGCIVPGVTGELFRTSDRQDLARVLADLADRPERAAAMGAAGRDFIARHASPEGAAARLEEMLAG